MPWSRRSRRSIDRGRGSLYAIDPRIDMLAKILNPGPLDAGIVGRGFHKIHEVLDVSLEPPMQEGILDRAVVAKRGVRLGKREHVGVHPRPQMLERNAERPETAIAAHHRG